MCNKIFQNTLSETGILLAEVVLLCDATLAFVATVDFLGRAAIEVLLVTFMLRPMWTK